MHIGICKLCQQNRELQKSHFLPASLYRMSRIEGEPNPNPWQISAKGRYQTSKQIQDFVFCRKCEELLCKNGERYAMSQVNGRAGFPLLRTLQTSAGSRSSGGFTFYDRSTTGAIDRQKLGYFALSVFWRGSVHVWKESSKKAPVIQLGEYDEPVRRYLLGETPFPAGIAVMLFVCTDQFSQGVFYEPSRGNDGDVTTWTFMARGLNFFLSGTEGQPVNLANACMVTGEKGIIVARSCHDKVLGAVVQLVLAAQANNTKGRPQANG
jgi:hypothetical protein